VLRLCKWHPAGQNTYHALKLFKIHAGIVLSTFCLFLCQSLRNLFSHYPLCEHDSRHAASSTVWWRHCVFNSDERHAHYERNSHAQQGYRYNRGSVSLLIWKNISQQSMNYSEYQWLVFGTLLEHFDFTTRSIICLLFYTGLRALVNTVMNSGFHRNRRISLLDDKLQNGLCFMDLTNMRVKLSLSLFSRPKWSTFENTEPWWIFDANEAARRKRQVLESNRENNMVCLALNILSWVSRWWVGYGM